MKTLFTLLFLFYFLQTAMGQLQSKKCYPIVKEVKGDLDNDGMDEWVLVYDTDDSTDFGNIREIQILKKVNGQWSELASSRNAILSSDAGGLMGDPLVEISIEEGILIVEYYGGSAWRWHYSDIYRYQNGQFELIGYTAGGFKMCESFWECDFNLSTGKMVSSKGSERCENGEQEVYNEETETFYKKGIKITLQNRNTKDILIESPKYKHKIYL